VQLSVAPRLAYCIPAGYYVRKCRMMFDWDDLKVFIAAARAGSLAGASLKLGVDAATVGRRVARLESSLKSTLIIRSQWGLQLTAAGAKLLEAALDVETAMLKAARTGEEDVVGGTVRISAAEGFGTTILAPALPALRQQRSGLRIELAASSGFLSPGRREVDMAVTLSAPSDPRVLVEPLTDYQLALYAAPEYLASRASPSSIEGLKAHDIVGYVDDLIYAPELRYLDELGFDLRPSIASSSIRAQREILAAAGGIGVLPCFMAAGLIPLLTDQVVLTRRFWMSTHADVVDTARVRAVRRWMAELVVAHRPSLSPF
jgi:DNA-binding transcriptional LysR family regulator